MNTGRTVKIHKNVPAPIPIELPKKKETGNTPDVKEVGQPIPISLPIRKKEKVESVLRKRLIGF